MNEETIQTSQNSQNIIENFDTSNIVSTIIEKKDDEKEKEYTKMELLVETKQIIPNVLCLSGGGIKGLLLLGALQRCYDTDLMNNITTFIGTSIGSIICYLLILGYKPLEILQQVCKKKVLDIFKYPNLANITNLEGIFSYKDLANILEEMTIEKAEKIHTLSSLKKEYNKELIAVSYNLKTRSIEYLSYITHPDLPCLTAIKMSSNVPFLFGKFFYDGAYHIDGGIANNFPIIEAKKYGSVLGIALNKQYPIPDKKSSILEYIYAILSVPIEELHKIIYKENTTDENNIILNLNTNLFLFNFSLNDKEMYKLYKSGYLQTIKQINNATFLNIIK